MLPFPIFDTLVAVPGRPVHHLILMLTMLVLFSLMGVALGHVWALPMLATMAVVIVVRRDFKRWQLETMPLREWLLERVVFLAFQISMGLALAVWVGQVWHLSNFWMIVASVVAFAGLGGVLHARQLFINARYLPDWGDLIHHELATDDDDPQ